MTWKTQKTKTFQSFFRPPLQSRQKVCVISQQGLRLYNVFTDLGSKLSHSSNLPSTSSIKNTPNVTQPWRRRFPPRHSVGPQELKPQLATAGSVEQSQVTQNGCPLQVARPPAWPLAHLAALLRQQLHPAWLGSARTPRGRKRRRRRKRKRKKKSSQISFNVQLGRRHMTLRPSPPPPRDLTTAAKECRSRHPSRCTPPSADASRSPRWRALMWQHAREPAGPQRKTVTNSTNSKSDFGSICRRLN